MSSKPRRLMAAASLVLSVGLGAVRVTSAAQVVEHEDSVPDEYIILLNETSNTLATSSVAMRRSQSVESETDESADRRARAEALANAYGAELIGVFEHELGGLCARMSRAQAESMARDPQVSIVEQNAIFRANAVREVTSSWALDRIDQKDLPLDGDYNRRRNGQGVHVYVVDSGLRGTHRQFKGRVGAGFSAIKDGRSWKDCDGHGTQVAAALAGASLGVASGAIVHPVRVLDCKGEATLDEVLQGIDWVTANHVKPAVANLSLGGPASPALDQAVRQVVQAGVSVSVAAGNSGDDACLESPARVPEVLTVGASNPADALYTSTNTGACVDLFAPGVNVPTSTQESDDSLGVLTGTSVAAPLVAGVAALYLQTNPQASPAEVHQVILDRAILDRLQGLSGTTPNRLLSAKLDLFSDETPVASFVAVCSDTGCRFDASASSHPDGIVDYFWDLGDGETDAGEVVTHAYQVAGVFNVRLIVTAPNGKTAEAVQSLRRGSDLVVDAISFETPPQVGVPTTVLARLSNQGERRSEAFNIRWSLNGDERFHGAHDGLDKGGVSDGNAQIAWTPTVGTHIFRFAVDVDRHVDEIDETNNVRELTITLTDDRPDLAPNVITFSTTPKVSRTTSVSTEIRNLGTAASGAFTYKWQVNGQDIHSATHPGLGPGEKASVQRDWIPTVGSHEVRIVVDPSNQVAEVNERNNEVFVQVLVSAPNPDLFVSDIRFSAVPKIGQKTTAIAQLANIGPDATDVFNVKWFLNGQQVAYGNHRALAAGELSDGNVRFDWTPTAGTHRLKFVADVDGHIVESDESNNASETVVTLTAPGSSELPVVSVIASYDDGNVPVNTRDGSLDTRWSAFGRGHWIQYDLGSVKTVGELRVAFYKGDERIQFFQIQLSIDGVDFQTVADTQASGSTLDLERFDIGDSEARYVRIVGLRNSYNGWNSLTEVRIRGSAGTSAPTPNPNDDLLPVASVLASYHHGNGPENTLDGSLDTYWSAFGRGQWIQYDLGAQRTVDKLRIAVYKGHQRIQFFQIQVSNDGSNFVTVADTQASGHALVFETFSIASSTARYVRIVGLRNSNNGWNALTEVQILGR